MSDDTDDAIVIKFPVRHCRPEILSDEINRRNEAAKKYYVYDITMRFLEQAAEAFLQMGIDVAEEPYVKDFAYFQLVVEGVFARSAELPHPIHPVVDTGKAARDASGNMGYVWGTVEKVKVQTANTSAGNDSG